MNELHLQDKFLVPFLRDTLGYQEVKANTVSNSLIIEEDLEAFVSSTELNKKPYEALLKKYGGDRKKLLTNLIELIQERSGSSRNMALFLNANKAVTLQGIKLHLFYTADSVIHDNALFDQNIFSVVQELPYKYLYEGKQIYSFRPDLCFFVNGIYLGYSELKSNFNNQNASKNGRGKVVKDYFEAAVKAYFEHVEANTMLSEKDKEFYRRDFLKVFEKAIHITTTDIKDTYVIRNISDFFDDILETCRAGKFDREEYEKRVTKVFKPYPLLNPDAEKKDKFKELFTTHYGKNFMEREILCSYSKLLKVIASLDVLIIDDWGLEPLSAATRNDLMEIMDDRYEQSATVIISQLPTEQWYEAIGDNTLADAILDRLMHNAHRMNLQGESMRKKMNSLTQVEHLE